MAYRFGPRRFGEVGRTDVGAHAAPPDDLGMKDVGHEAHFVVGGFGALGQEPLEGFVRDGAGVVLAREQGQRLLLSAVSSRRLSGFGYL
jgi:hypothetical protein